MKKSLSILLAVTLLWVPSSRLKNEAHASGSAAGYALPIILILGSIGALWYGSNSTKKWEKAQAEKKAKLAESPAASPVLLAHNDVKDGLGPTTPESGEASASNKLEGFANAVVINAHRLTDGTFKDLKKIDGDQVDMEPRDHSKLPYKDRSAIASATDLHIYWALKNAGCNMNVDNGKNHFTSDSIHSPQAWKDYFEKHGKGAWENKEKSTPQTEDFLKSDYLNKFPGGSVIVYDCTQEEVKENKFPVVEIINPSSQYPPFFKNNGLVNVIKVDQGLIDAGSRCKKIAGVYYPNKV